jgi:hypothetical protein
MRWAQVRRAEAGGYGPGNVTLIATPLYSNTTLVVVVPTLARGGCLVLMPKFDCAQYLALAVQHRATHTMLVPVQYQRLMHWPDFDRHDLSQLPVQGLHQRALPRRAEGRGAAPLARRPDRVLRHDRRRRQLHPVLPPAPDQAAHRGPAGREPRHPADRRGRERTAARCRRDRRSGGPLPGDDERVPQPARQVARGRVVRRAGPALHPHRRRRPLRRGRLPGADGPPQGHDHQRRLQHLPQRPGSRIARTPGGGRRGRGRRAQCRMGRDPVAFVVRRPATATAPTPSASG